MSDYPFVLNGNSYDLSSFAAFAYTTNFPLALSDAVSQALLLHTGTSSTSLTVGTGSKALTTQTNKAFRAGDQVVIAGSAAPDANRMYGTVATYVPSTGALTITVTSFTGSGTLTAWWIALGGYPAANAAAVLAVDQGGTGTPGTGFALAGNFVGFGDPCSSMAEIYEEFSGTQGSVSGVIDPPWYMPINEGATRFPDPSGLWNGTKTAGFMQIQSTAVTGTDVGSKSTILLYGQYAFFHVGRGATIYETNVNIAGVRAKFGLKCNASGVTPDIFSGGGIGFEYNALQVNGRYVLYAGSYGSPTRLVTGIVPSAGFDRCRIEVDHDGNRVDFYINGILAGSMSTAVLPLSSSGRLLQPAYEAAANINSAGVVTNTTLYIDSMQLRKYLCR